MKKVFVNEDIFDSDGDYVIGGFKTDKKEGFTYSDFYEAVSKRIKTLLEDYIKRAAEFNKELGIENPEEAAKNDAVLLVFDYLKLSPEYNSVNDIANAIMDCDKMKSWLMKIKSNIQEVSDSFAQISIKNEAFKHSKEQVENAEYFTDEAGFEQLIEQLSIIEL